MNFSLITRLESTKGRDMSAWECAQLLQWQLTYRIPNFSVAEVEQLEHVLVHYKRERMERTGGVTEHLLTKPHDRRAEVLIGEGLLSNTSGEF